jgi:hypothetical protein
LASIGFAEKSATAAAQIARPEPARNVWKVPTALPARILNRSMREHPPQKKKFQLPPFFFYKFKIASGKIRA